MKIKDFFRRPVVHNLCMLILGYLTYKKIKIRYGRDTHIFLIRGKTGDIFLYFRLLDEYCKKNNISKYVLVGDGKGLATIKKLYPNITGDCCITSEKIGLALQNLYCFLGGPDSGMTLSLMWDVDLMYNRCATRLTDRFNFMDSFYWFLFDLDEKITVPKTAVFSSCNDKLLKQLNKWGIVKDKTVIIAPYAYCVKLLPVIFWNTIIAELKKRGYYVFAMLDEWEKNDFGVPSVFFKYQDSIAVLEYAGHFIGLRSGFCDIASSADCNKVILYPKKPEEFDGSVHRGDLEYSSLITMKLTNSATEVVLPFARDILNCEAETEVFDKRMQEDRGVFQEIFNCFPMLH